MTQDDTLLNVHQVAERTGHSVQTIRKLRTNTSVAKHGPHPLYAKAFKLGPAGGSARLKWCESDVDAYLDDCRAQALQRSALA